MEGRWLQELSQRGLPMPDAEPLGPTADGRGYAWRRHYVAVVFPGTGAQAVQQLEDLGFEVIPFEDPSAWNEGFARLAAALGGEA